MDPQIEVSGADRRLPEQSSGDTVRLGSRMLAATTVGVAIGAAITLIFTTGRTTSPSTDDGTEATLPPPSTTDIAPRDDPAEPTLVEIVPGLESDLIGFGFSPSGRSVVERWPNDATEPDTIDVPFGLAIADLSKTWIAALVSQRYGGSSNLHVGNITYQEVIATNVGSAVWSSDRFQRIAWTETGADGVTARSRTLGRDRERSETAIPVPEDSRVVWLDGETLTLASSDSLIAFGPDGTEIARLDGALFGAATDGWAVIWRDDELTLIDTELTPRGVVPLDGEGCSAASFAPYDPASSSTFRSLAVLCDGSDRHTLEVLEVDPLVPSFDRVSSLELDEPGRMTWLDGGRFVAIPQPDPQSRPRSMITILDTETERVSVLVWPGAVFGVLGVR